MKYEWVSVDECPVCQSNETEKYGIGFSQKYDGGTGRTLKADICLKCKTMYQNPVLSDTSLEEFYRSGTYDRDYPRQIIRESARADRLVMIVDRFKIEPKSCLDVGCGTGLLLKHLEAYFFARILGLEYTSMGFVIDEVVHSKEDVQGTFDLVTCIHTLEHVSHPLDLIRWMVSKLNPGGTIIIELPMEKKVDMAHVQIFGKEALDYMMKKVGMNYLHLESESISILVVGDKYKDYTAKRVFFSYDSPDFSTQQQYMEWFTKWYMVEAEKQNK